MCYTSVTLGHFSVVCDFGIVLCRVLRSFDPAICANLGRTEEKLEFVKTQAPESISH